MTWEDAVAATAHLPGIEVSTSYGTPALKAGGKLLARLRTEDDSLVLLGIEPDEAAMLIGTQPAIFHTTPHYDGYRAVLARLGPLSAGTLVHFIERWWREVAPRRMVRAYDEARG